MCVILQLDCFWDCVFMVEDDVTWITYNVFGFKERHEAVALYSYNLCFIKLLKQNKKHAFSCFIVADVHKADSFCIHQCSATPQGNKQVSKFEVKKQKPKTPVLNTFSAILTLFDCKMFTCKSS